MAFKQRIDTGQLIGLLAECFALLQAVVTAIHPRIAVLRPPQQSTRNDHHDRQPDEAEQKQAGAHVGIHSILQMERTAAGDRP